MLSMPDRQLRDTTEYRTNHCKPPRKYPLKTKGKQPNKHRGGGGFSYTETTEGPATTEVREIQLGMAWVQGRHVKWNNKSKHK
jgi:hypothetical protein